MIDLQISTEGLDRLVLDLAATEPQAAKALNSTLTKMATWLKAQSVKGLSSTLSIQQKVIRRRLRTLRLSKSGSGSKVTVWYGLDPIAVIYLQARQTKRGVKASGGRFVPGGFIANGRNQNRQVFLRRGKARLPIDRQVAEVENEANTYIEDKLLGSEEFERRFFQTFEHELKWRTQTQ